MPNGERIDALAAAGRRVAVLLAPIPLALLVWLVPAPTAQPAGEPPARSATAAPAPEGADRGAQGAPRADRGRGQPADGLHRTEVPGWSAAATSVNASLQQSGSPGAIAVLTSADLPPLVLPTGETHPARPGVYASPTSSPPERPG